MKPVTADTYRERLLRVLVHIQTHLDEALSLDELARLAHSSPYHFHRIFRGMVGESLADHVRRLRLERAANRLRNGRAAVKALASEAGYASSEAFGRAFAAYFGAAPSAYRALRRKELGLPAVASGVHFGPDGVVNGFSPCTRSIPMDVSIETLPPLRVAFIRHVGPYAEAKASWERLMRWAGQRRLIGPMTRFLGVCHDDPEVTPADKIRYDAAITVPPGVEAEGEVGVQEVGGREYARAIHIGPYAKLPETYAYLCGQWAPMSGRELASAPCMEIYVSDPRSTPEDQLRTDVFAPLEPAA